MRLYIYIYIYIVVVYFYYVYSFSVDDDRRSICKLRFKWKTNLSRFCVIFADSHWRNKKTNCKKISSSINKILYLRRRSTFPISGFKERNDLAGIQNWRRKQHCACVERRFLALCRVPRTPQTVLGFLNTNITPCAKRNTISARLPSLPTV